MAQTWRITPAKVFAFRLIDFLGYPFRRLLSPPPAPDQEIRSILVIEPWLIGDVVLATPILRALRERYPTARITLLGKAHATELLRDSGLVDEIMVVDLPWTARRRKYDPRRYDLRALRDLVAELRRRRFDLSVDARMDLRSNLLTYLSGSPRRVGYAFGGGSFLLTDAVTAMPNAHHRVNDWLALLEPLERIRDAPPSREGIARAAIEPALNVTEDERRVAADRLRASGIQEDDLLIGVHSGASDPRRRWPAENFERVAADLAARFGARVLFFVDPDAPDVRIGSASVTLQASLREMMALLTHCDLFLCNDSGPMHIADALDVPVVAVFLTGNPVWHRPFRPYQRVVGKGTGHDFLIPPEEYDVISAAESLLRERGKVSEAAAFPAGSAK